MGVASQRSWIDRGPCEFVWLQLAGVFFLGCRCGTIRRMPHEQWASTDWPLLTRLEERSSAIPSPVAAAEAICRSADRIPPKSAWRCWPHLLVLTIAGLHLALRSSRVELAKRAARFLTGDELATLCCCELRQGHGPGYLRTLLVSRPGDMWSRLRYPLEVLLGQEDVAPALRPEVVGQGGVVPPIQGHLLVLRLPSAVRAEREQHAAEVLSEVQERRAPASNRQVSDAANQQNVVAAYRARWCNTPASRVRSNQQQPYRSLA